jgi:prevent-host-death family protein
MRRVPVRELNQHTSAVLARVQNTGEPVEITKDGVPIARLVPIDEGRSALDRLVSEGRVAPPSVTGPVPMPPALGDPEVDIAAELVAARDEERW